MDIHNDEKVIELIVSLLAKLFAIERIIVMKSGEINDEGISSMMSDFIVVEQEKTIWMMKAWQQE